MKIVKICLLLFTLLIVVNISTDKAQAADYYSIIYNEVSQYNSDPVQIDWTTNAILYASTTYQIDPLLYTSLLEQESHFNINAVSPVGAIGMAQLMPDTAQAIGVNPYNPLENIIGGASYLRTQLDNFSGYGMYATTYAVAAYNAGPQAIIDSGGVPPYEETINYIYSISDIFNRLNSYRY